MPETRLPIDAVIYEIGGLCCEMTPSQAHRWNDGDLSASLLASIVVSVPGRGNTSSRITARRATNQRLSPETARVMDGAPANLIA